MMPFSWPYAEPVKGSRKASYNRMRSNAPQTVLILQRPLPPVNGFWSLILYDLNCCLVADQLNRYSRSSGDDLKLGDDGPVAI